MGTLIKICGIRTAEHALAAAEAGADMIGFIFAPARRQITPDQAAAIAEQVRAFQARQQGTHRAQLVGVFVNQAPARINAIAADCNLDTLQLSGNEAVAVLQALPFEHTLLKTVRFDGSTEEQGWMDTLDSPRARLHIEAHVSGAYGGTGIMADWRRAALLARQRHIVLAGGLTPENVGAAIADVRPWGVDVSSGVELNGRKDSAKIEAFIAAVRAADLEHTIQIT